MKLKITDETIEEILRQRIKDLVESGEHVDESLSPLNPVHIREGAECTDLLNHHVVTIVDFYFDWCEPCKMIDPVLEELAGETDATIGKVDIDENSVVDIHSRRYPLRAIGGTDTRSP